ncbi:MAG: NADPH:quinone reductase [Candidatus Dormibacteria bacterium]
MRAVVYERFGGPEVLQLVEREEPQPGPGEVLVQVAFSGVNPTDHKSRRGPGPGGSGRLPFKEIVPNQDGSGTVLAVGEGVDRNRVGEDVWLWEAAWQRPQGTAQEQVSLPQDQAVPLPPGTPLELGACIGIPALTAHRCLTVAELGPTELRPGALGGRRVLVAGGAGAVGHAAIELARWSGAEVLATVSSDEKARLARAAGADHVVDYRHDDAEAAVHRLWPEGADVIVEVAPGPNAAVDQAVLAPHGCVALYASDQDQLSLEIRRAMTANARYQFVLVYTEPAAAKRQAIEDVSVALAQGALRCGVEAGLPLHRFPLERAQDAHRAVEEHVVGKVLIEI